jgi:ParB family chromosome partitioning protein
MEARDADLLYDAEGEVLWNLEYTGFPLDEDLGVAIQRARVGVDSLETYLPFLDAERCKRVYQECQELNTRNIWRLRCKLEARALEVAFGWREDGKPWGKEEKKVAVAQAFGVSVKTIQEDERALSFVLEGYDGPRAALFVEEERERDSETIAECRTGTKPHVAQATGESEWFTPPEYTEAARYVMGGIDLDPASCERANEIVQAGTFYDKEQDGLAQTWAGRVWMNPPYSQPLVTDFAEKMVESVKAQQVSQACVLVNNATDTAWLQSMLAVCTAVCFLRGRVRFLDETGEAVGAPLQGQVILYFGHNTNGFRHSFQSFGLVLRRFDG